MKKGAKIDGKIGTLEKALISAIKDQNYSRQEDLPVNDGSGLLGKKYPLLSSNII